MEERNAEERNLNNGFKFSMLHVLSIFIFASLLVITVFMLWRTSRKSTDILIYEDIQLLSKIFEKINRECRILGFVHDKNYIDFLTVKDFVGSEVGSMNLMLAQQWKGPYLKDNPTIQQRQYQILHAQKGYFIVPGDGIVLGNGKKIGTDFVLDKNSDMSKILKDTNQLMSPVGALAVEIQVGSSALAGAMQGGFIFQDID